MRKRVSLGLRCGAVRYGAARYGMVRCDEEEKGRSRRTRAGQCTRSCRLEGGEERMSVDGIIASGMSYRKQGGACESESNGKVRVKVR
jgi:hypothetical protein